MAARNLKRRRHWLLRLFRGVLIFLLLLVFVIIAGGVYLNEVGLPDFLKRPLLKKLQARGLVLEFTRVRWRWHRGFVAEKVQFGGPRREGGGPRFFGEEVELKINHAALLHFNLTVDAVTLRGGELVWPVQATNEPPLSLALTNIQTLLTFRPGDQWDLDHFTAAFVGGKLHFSGLVTNASAIGDWSVFKGGGAGGAERARARLHDFARRLEEIKVAGTPEIKLVVNGDARDLRSFGGLLTVRADGAETPWGSLANGVLIARLAPTSVTNREPQAEVRLSAEHAATRWGVVTNGLLFARLTVPGTTNSQGEIELRVEGAGTPWANGKNLVLTLRGAAEANSTNLVRAQLEARMDTAVTEWAQATNARFSAQWTHSLTNPIPVSGSGELSLADVRTRWATAGQLHLDLQLDTPTNAGPSKADASWAWWGKLEPYHVDWNCRLKGIHAREFELAEADCGGLWRAPELTITNLDAQMYQGHFDAQALLNVATRLVTFSATSDFDAQKAMPLLTPDGQRWLTQYTWKKPPLAHATGIATLAAWTNTAPDWRGEVGPTLSLAGDFKAVDGGAFRGVPVIFAQSHFNYTNRVWDLPDLIARRPEGVVELALRSDENTKDFYFKIHSTIDARPMRELLDTNARRGFDFFAFTEPPQVDAELWGRWHEPDRMGGKAVVTLTNFTFRGEYATYFHATIQYTNQYLKLFDGRIERPGGQFATAPYVAVDIPARKLFLTNGVARMEPLPFLHAIGPKVTKTMEPYQFLKAPFVQCSGVIPLEEDVAPDVHFTVDGDQFHWMNFNVAHINGKVDWVGDNLAIHGVNALFYDGRMNGSAAFDFSRSLGTDFSFDITTTNSNLQALMADISNRTNHLEGLLTARLTVTQANTEDWKSWFGSGWLQLRDGLIWDIPIFGMFSPLLDKVTPGLGKSRASAGGGTFTITNSVIRSPDFEIRAPALRMTYHGTVDFQGRLDAIVEADPLRDAWLVGRLVSAALWPVRKFFEYHLTGTLIDPKSEPRFVLPSLLSVPFLPFKAIKEMMPGEPKEPPPKPQFPVPAPPK